MMRMVSRGFSLIELMVALAIASILLVLAAPNYAVWVADGQIRAGAESIANGLRLAYGEAVKRNASVNFVIDPATTTGGWQVILVSDNSVLREEHWSDGAKLAAFGADGTTVTFTSLGLIDPATTDLTTVAVTFSGPTGNTRPLNVLVGGGRTGIKVCDPDASVLPNDPRYCTT